MNISEMRAIKITLFIAPFIVIINICDFSGLPQGLFLQLSAIFIAGVWWLNNTQKGYFELKKNPLYVPVVLWIIWLSFYLFKSSNTYESILIAKQWWTGAILFFIISGCSKDKTQKILPVLFWSGFFVAIVGLFQFFLDFQLIPQVRPPSSTFGHKNVAIHYIMLTLPAGVSIFMVSEKPLKNYCYGFSLSLIFLYIYTTYTRAGWVIFLFMFLFLTILLVFDKKKYGIKPVWYSGKSVPLLIGIIFSLILINFSDNQKNFSSAIKHVAGATQSVFQQISNNENDKAQTSVIDNSFTGRIEVWINSLAMIKDFPFTGTGVGNYRIHFQKYQNEVVNCSWINKVHRVYNAHNDHIQFLVELGIIGLTLWIFLLWRFFKTFYFTLQKNLSPSLRYIMIGPLLAIINVLVNACFSFPFQMSIPPIIFMVYLGILCSWIESDSIVKININKKIGYAVFIMFPFLFILMLNASYAMIKSDRHFLKMIIAERIKKWPMVISEANSVLKYNPYAQEVHSFIGRAELESGYYKKAIKSFDMVLKYYPYHVNSIANKGLALLKSGKPDEAAMNFKQALDYLPIFIKIRKMLVNIYINQNKFNDELIHELILIRKKEPKNLNVLSNLAVAYIKTSKLTEAITLLKTILEIQPTHATANAYMSLIMLNAGKTEAAEQLYKNVKFDNSTLPQVYFILGKLALEMNKDDALKLFVKAVQMNPVYNSQLFDIANAYKQKKLYKRAMKAYQILIHIQPSHAGAHNNLGNIFRDIQMNDRAFKEYLAAVTCDPGNEVFHFNAGLMAINVGDFKTAEQALKKAIQLKPDWALAHKNLAVLLHDKLKRINEAVFHFSKALNLDPMIENHDAIRKILIHHTQNSNPYHKLIGEKK